MKRGLGPALVAALAVGGCGGDPVQDSNTVRIAQPATSVPSPLGGLRSFSAQALLPSGEVLLMGGFDSTGIPTTSTELWDPRTSSVRPGPQMLVARAEASAVVLESGQVLVTGGLSDDLITPETATAELYTPGRDGQLGSFSAVGAMQETRFWHTLNRLPSGNVLVAGGCRSFDPNTFCSGDVSDTTEIYDPDSQTFSASGALQQKRARHTGTLLADGRVMLTSGVVDLTLLSLVGEVFDPVAGAGVLTDPMPDPKLGAATTLLPSGDVLVAGGYDVSLAALDSVLVFDPSSGNNGAFSTGPNLLQPRAWAGAQLHPSGDVLYVGGCLANIPCTPTSHIERYSTSDSGVEVPLGIGRGFPATALMPNGTVFVATGTNDTSLPTAALELHDADAVAAMGDWSAGPAWVPRDSHTATPLLDGRVLLTGGFDGAMASAEAWLFDPEGSGGAGTLTQTASMAVRRTVHAAVLLPSGKVLIVGGEGPLSIESSTEIFDPAANGGAGAFVAGPTMSSPRSAPIAVLLPTGKVLVAGGFETLSQSSVLRSAELYDPEAGPLGGFSSTGSLQAPRTISPAVILENGSALIVGRGAGGESYSELYDPIAGAFSPTAAPIVTRIEPTAELLFDGRVLVAGGAVAGAAAEIYDPVLDTWTSAGAGLSGRIGLRSVLLPSGKVLISGGCSDLSCSARFGDAVLYDPRANGGAGAFLTLAGTYPGRWAHSLTRLPDGRVLAAGGCGVSGQCSSSLADSWLWDPTCRAGGSCTRTAQDSRRPALGLPSTVQRGASAVVAGARLLGLGEGHSGHPVSMASNHPIGLFMPAAPGPVAYGSVESFNDTSATWHVPRRLWPGPGFFHVVTQGVSSHGRGTTIVAGLQCSVALDCPSGVCVDGVCCDRACDGVCEACTAALKGSGLDGTCGPIAADNDPQDECADAGSESCGTTGSCDGAAACAFYSSSTECAPAVCANGEATPARNCDGAGTCVSATSVVCAPGSCNSAGDACRFTCVTDDDCAQGAFCGAGGNCQPLLPNGSGCAQSEECESGFCTDDVCCNTSCGGQCEACDLPAAPGVCSVVQGAPRGERPTCAGEGGACAGACDGSNPLACDYPDTETPCAATSCTEGVETQPLCDGAGACAARRDSDCGRFTCGASGSCNTRCLQDSDCADEFECREGDCVARTGNRCEGNSIINSAGERVANCLPYRCDPETANCVVECASTSDCVQGYACTASSTCEPAAQGSSGGESGGCACRHAGNTDRSAHPAWLLLGLVLAWRRRSVTSSAGSPSLLAHDVKR